jgi:pyrimidine-nucleoside phosphorylase
MSFNMTELIQHKRKGQRHSESELEYIITGFVAGEIPDYQVSAWLMAVCFQGMEADELAQLTRLMRDSGKVMDFSHLPGKTVDKHSTGGVGDKTTLVLAPIAAAAGVFVPMIAGRALGHTGGTVDKLESIPGFRVDWSDKQFSQLVAQHHIGLIGQTDEICPADKKLYALRDVTATVESIPLITASIMSKKLAEGLSALVLDVKFGSGALMKNLQDAKVLAEHLILSGEKNGLKVSVLLTDMNQPLGRFVGNSLEVKECLDILRGEDQEYYAETRELSLWLAAHMIWRADLCSNVNEGYARAQEILKSGEAYRKFEEMCQAQGQAQIDQLPMTTNTQDFCARQTGWINSINTEAVGWASIAMGSGRKSLEDQLDPCAGIEFHCKLGRKVEQGEKIATLYAQNSNGFTQARKILDHAILIEKDRNAQTNHPLVHSTMNGKA